MTVGTYARQPMTNGLALFAHRSVRQKLFVLCLVKFRSSQVLFNFDSEITIVV